MTHENKEEKSVAELLKEVISLTPKEVQAGRLPSLNRSIVFTRGI